MSHRFRWNRSLSHFLLVLLLSFCLCLPGCAAKPPDKCWLTPTGLGDDYRSFYLDVSGTSETSEDEVNALRKCLREQIDRGRWEVVDTPDENTVMVKVEMREMFRARKGCRFNPFRWVGTAIGGGIVGCVLGGTLGAREVGPVRGALLGMGVGMLGGICFAMESCQEIWAVRAGVGIALGRPPDELEEVIINNDLGKPRNKAMPWIAMRMAEAILGASCGS